MVSTDELFPTFILDELPQGISGLLIAGILAATMGSLSAAINSLSNSTVIDLVRTFWRRDVGEQALLRIARVSTVVWAAGFVVFASMFDDTENQVVVIGHPSRVSGEYRVLMVTLKRPSDGFTWGTRTGEAVD